MIIYTKEEIEKIEEIYPLDNNFIYLVEDFRLMKSIKLLAPNGLNARKVMVIGIMKLKR